MTASTEDKLLRLDDGGCLYESGYYWDDENHEGHIIISQRMVDKYNLEGDADSIEEFFDCITSNDEEREECRKEYKNYTHELYVHHCAGWSKRKEEVDYGDSYSTTPHGETYSDEFVMWWLGYPLELLSEPKEDVLIYSWCDG